MQPDMQSNIESLQIAYPSFFRRIGSSFVDFVSGIGLIFIIEMLIELIFDILLFAAVQMDLFLYGDYFTSHLIDIIVSLSGPTMGVEDILRFENLQIKAGAFIALPFIFAWFESSIRQTLGKRLFKLIVVNKQFKRISFKHAICRNLAKIITVCTLGIGYFLILFSNKTLHDKISGTIVINSSSIDKEVM